MKKEDKWSDNIVFKSKNGLEYSLDTTIYPQFNQSLKLEGYVSIVKNTIEG
jgi:hypothetical protein